MSRATTRVTVEQYDAMIRRGEFEPSEEHQVELIYGEITPMSPIGIRHVETLMTLNEWSFEAPPPKAVRVSVQGAIAIAALDSEPQPDLLWIRRRDDYHLRLPTPADVVLAIEVAESSLPKDRGIKARLYAEAGIVEYWIVNLVDRCVEIRRDPREGAYRSVTVHGLDEVIRPLAFPDAALAVRRLFPE